MKHTITLSSTVLLTAKLLRIQVFWDVMPSWMNVLPRHVVCPKIMSGILGSLIGIQWIRTEAERSSEMFKSTYPSAWHHMPEVQNLQDYSSSVLDNIYAVQSHILEESIHFVTVISFNTDLW